MTRRESPRARDEASLQEVVAAAQAGADDRASANVGEESGSKTATPTFALGSLGWKAFQDLCGTILGVVLGQTATSFRPTKDSGRDLAFEGDWVPQGGEALSGKYVVQCKHKSRDNFYRSDLTDEIPKVRKLVKEGRCDTYILMTNAGMTASTAADIQDDLAGAGVKSSFLVGGDMLDRYLRETPQLRAMVPRLYGLGDLTQILDERRYAQAAALLASMREDISKFVITEPYRRAIRAMMAHGFVLLIGAPAAGKSMIASALAAASIDLWGCRPIKVESAAAFASAWNPYEPNQFFWIDDAFGATQYQRQRSDEWNQVLTHLRASVAQGTRVVMTSRDYIWADAVDDLKLSAFPVLRSGQVVVDVHDLDLEDKRQILYNHLKYGNQPREFRSSVKAFLEAGARVDDFLPEVARRFGDAQFTRKVVPYEWSVVAFFERPVEHLEEVVAGLGLDEFASLAVLFMNHGSRTSPIEPTAAEQAALGRLGSTVAGLLRGLASLRGSLVVLGTSADNGRGAQWSFKHPTIGDAVRRRIATRPELLEIYLTGSALESLLTEITCGDIGLESALVVPAPYFGLVASRLSEINHDPAHQTRVANFLVTRCGAEFLAGYGATVRSLDVDPDEPGSLRIAARLNSLGLLAEPVRATIVAYYERMAEDWLDLRILTDAELRGLVHPDEDQRILQRLRDEVIPELSSYVDLERDNFDGTAAPEDVAGRLREALETLLVAFPADDEVDQAVQAAQGDVDRLEQGLAEDWPGGPDDDGDWRDHRPMKPVDSGVFADVDE